MIYILLIAYFCPMPLVFALLARFSNEAWLSEAIIITAYWPISIPELFIAYTIDAHKYFFIKLAEWIRK